MKTRLSLRAVRPLMTAAALAWLAAGIATPLRADIVNIIDPPGAGEIDEEIGNITEAAFEALGPVVNDHEHGTGPQFTNEPFMIGDVAVTGRYGNGAVPGCANFSGGRVSFTQACTFQGAPAGSWMNTQPWNGNVALPAFGNQLRVRLEFAPPPGEIVTAAGLAYMGRYGRGGGSSADVTLTGTVTYADGTTLSRSIVIDGEGNAVPNGKDVFIGFQDADGRGGILSLEAVGIPLFSSAPFLFHGWDDVGVVTESAVMDGDDDGITDDEDNCPADANTDQADTDADSQGDACDGDDDGDGVSDTVDNCSVVINPDQTDWDGDDAGDACDADDDDDAVADAQDNCQFSSNSDQSDYDGDFVGDACDSDADGDGVEASDNCPRVPNPDQTNTDGDALGDDCDADDDNDGVCDACHAAAGCAAGPDNCPMLANPGQQDLDADRIGDACDADRDGDGVDNEADYCPDAADPSNDDSDGDLLGDACDPDDDNDGIGDSTDNCAFVPNAGQGDVDDDDLGDACDSDLDGDGVENAADNCSSVPNADQVNFDGDAAGDACDEDVDGDGVTNAGDACAYTEAGSVVMASGCSLEQFCPCSGPQGTTSAWRNHGKYVSCTAGAANQFVAAGLMTQAEKDATVSSAGQSDCGQ